MIIVGAAPVEVGPPVVLPSVSTMQKLGLVLVGVDGAVWDLVNGPVTLLMGNVVGLGDAEVLHTWSEGGVLDGARYQTSRYLPRSVTLPVMVSQPASSLLWRDLDAAWSDATSPAGECQLIATTPDARWRQLTMRRDTNDGGYERDPMVWGHAIYDCHFTATDPMWRGPTIRHEFRAEEPLDFFGPPGAAYVHYIASSESTATATVENPGHVRTWPTYTATGSVSGFTAGVGANTVVYGAVAAGAQVVVDTHPARQTVRTGTGGDAWPGLLDRKFAPIEPGARVPLNLALTGPGIGAEMLVELTPGYRRAL